LGETQLLDIHETAEMLRLKVSTIRAWVLQRRIPYVKLGGRVLFLRGECEAFIRAGMVAPDHRSKAGLAEAYA